MRRAEVLDTAKQAVTQDRQATHGRPEDTFATIAKLWTVYKGVPFTTTEVAMMELLLKVGRQRKNPKHEDNYVDMAGYAACAAELAETDRGVVQLHTLGSLVEISDVE